MKLRYTVTAGTFILAVICMSMLSVMLSHNADFHRVR